MLATAGLLCVALAILLAQPPRPGDPRATRARELAASRPARSRDGSIFRVTTRLVYKGKPVTIVQVAGCSLSKTGPEDRTDYSTLFPPAYGRAMEDGGALVVGTPFFCEGETTANGKVTEGWMPFVLRFTSKDDLSRGVGYLTSDAYDRPGSDLRFVSASVTATTRAELEEFRRTGPANVVSREAWAQKREDGVPPFADWCDGYTRQTFTRLQAERVRQQMPPGEAGYWEPERHFAWWVITDDPGRTWERDRDEQVVSDSPEDVPHRWVDIDVAYPLYGGLKRDGSSYTRHGRYDGPIYAAALYPLVTHVGDDVVGYTHSDEDWYFMFHKDVLEYTLSTDASGKGTVSCSAIHHPYEPDWRGMDGVQGSLYNSETIAADSKRQHVQYPLRGVNFHSIFDGQSLLTGNHPPRDPPNLIFFSDKMWMKLVGFYIHFDGDIR